MISKQILSILRAGILYYPFWKALRVSVMGFLKLKGTLKSWPLLPQMINKYAEWVVKSGLSHLYTHFSGILHPVAFEFDTEETVFRSLNGYKCDFKNSMLNLWGEDGNPQLNVFEFSFRRKIYSKPPSNDLFLRGHSILLWCHKFLPVVKITKNLVTRGLGYSCWSCQGLKFLKCKSDRQSYFCAFCLFVYTYIRYIRICKWELPANLTREGE